MPNYINTEKGLLVLPGGVEAPFGVEVKITADAAENPAVKGWIACGRLVPSKDWKPVAQDTIDALRAERDALQARVAELEAETAKLTADLAKATEPKK